MMTAVICICLVFLVSAFLTAPKKPSLEQKKPFSGRSYAHRGLHTQDKSVPENSLPAFLAAVSAGYGIELDIQLSSDGQVVVFHDDTLDRVCGVSGRVDAYSLQQLQSFQLAGSEEKIPLFTDVLKVIDGKVPLIVELKTSPRREELCRKAWAILQNYYGSFCVESFDPRIVAWFARYAKQVLRGQLTSSYRELRKYQNPIVSFAVSRCLVNVLGRPNFLAADKAHRNLCMSLTIAMGALPVAWTVRPEDDFSLLQEENDAVIFEFFTPKSVL